MANAAWGDLTWNTGTFGGINDQNVSVTGQSLTTSLSSVTALFQPNAGWGVSLATAQLLSTTLNSVTIDLNTHVNITGQNLTTALGSVTTKLDVNVLLTGNTLTGTTGQLYVTAWTPVDTGQSIVWTDVAA